MAIKAVIWDIGGVLERTEDFGPRRALAQRLGWEMEPLMDFIFGSSDGYRMQLGQITFAQHLQNLRQVLGQTEAEMDKTLEEFFAGDYLDTRLVDDIRNLHKTYTTAVLSNYSSRLRDKITRQWQIADAFDHLIISAEVGLLKPDPKIFQLTLARIGCQAGEAVFIDDVRENIAAAQKEGIYGVHFQNPAQALGELNAILHRNKT